MEKQNYRTKAHEKNSEKKKKVGQNWEFIEWRWF